MKTVTIPTCANPFVVIVNGIKYTYPAGATVEVPDEVAEVIEQHEEAKPEPAPVQPPYSGDDILAAANAYTDKKVAEGSGSGGGGLPVAEITTTLKTGATLTTKENEALAAAFEAAYEAEMPMVISAKLIADSIYQGFIALNPMTTGSTRFLTAAAYGYTVTLKAPKYGDNTWSVSVEKNEFKGLLVANTTTNIQQNAIILQYSTEGSILTEAFGTGTPVIIKWTGQGDYGQDVNYGMLFQRSLDGKLVSCTNNIEFEYDAGAMGWVCTKYEV